MKILSVEEQKARFENLRFGVESVVSCAKRHRIRDYIPGQVIYGLGPYPARFFIEPTEYDEKLIASLAQSGVGLIQLHEEWMDTTRHLGADRYSSHDPEGLKHFLELCHKNGIKVLPYMSTSYFAAKDPDFRRDFMNYESYLKGGYINYANCSNSSATWVNYLTEKLKRMLETYDFDGLYNDTGSEELCKRLHAAAREGRACTQEDLRYDPYEEDLFSRLYSFVHENGKIMKMHFGFNFRPVSDEKLYDYMWVGEGVSSTEEIMKATEFDPYVVPLPDFDYIDEAEVEKLFALSIPFLQFPMRCDGRPFDAEKILNEPIERYADSGKEEEHFRQIAKYHREHPDGPYCYSEWSSIPDNVEYREKWLRYLGLYLPMVEENNVCYMNITQSTLFRDPLPQKVFATLFTGSGCYLVLSNVSGKTQNVALNGSWRNRETGAVLSEATVPDSGILFLERVAL